MMQKTMIRERKIYSHNMLKMSIDQIFATIVSSTPEQKAVTCGNQSLTYAQLDSYSERVASKLEQIGIQKENIVVVALEQSIDFVISILAIIKSGAAYLPLDPTYPLERKKIILDDAKPVVMITHSKFSADYSEMAIKRICIDECLVVEDKEVIDNKKNIFKNSPNSLAYVLYTSGSTGKPKGVMIEHRSVTNSVINTNYIPFNSSDNVAQISNLSFDGSTTEIWGALLNGANLVIMPKEIILQTNVFKEYMKQHNISVLVVMARLFDKIVEEDVTTFSQLNTLVIGGDKLDPVKVALLANNKNGRPRYIFNGYGPTECTACAIAYDIESVEPNTKSIPIGLPIKGVVCDVLNKKLEPVDAGVIGELYIGGLGVARGYLNNPKLTKELFIKNISPDKPHAIFYKTGDRVYKTATGIFEFVGRIDNQVKLRGYRIELDEIVHALKEHEAVANAIIIFKNNEGGNQYLVAYIVPERNRKKSKVEFIDALRNFLAAKLPTYMVPSFFVILDEFPLNANGKIDKKQLPKPCLDRKSQTRFSNALEQEIADICCKTLGLSRIDRKENLFHLGANSLVASRIANTLSEITHKDIKLCDLFKYVTIESLAEKIIKTPTLATKNSIPQHSEVTSVPATIQQEQIWFLCQLRKHNRAYNAQFSIHFFGDLDKNILEKSINKIVKRHDILRTTFHDCNGKLIQRTHKCYSFQIQEVDISHLPEKDKKRQLKKLMESEVAHDFDIEQLPLFKVALFQIREKEYLFLQVEHHFIHDGWSAGLYLNELQAIYNVLLNKGKAALKPLSMQYADYAVWQREWFKTTDFKRQLNYWLNELKNAASIAPLRFGVNRPKAQRFKGGRLSCNISKNLYAKLKVFSKENGATLFITLYSIFALLIYRYTEQEEFCVGSAIANRDSKPAESVIGMFVNTIILRTSFCASMTFKQLLHQTKNIVLCAYANGGVPIESIVKRLMPNRVPSRNPLFQLMFAFHDSPVPELSFTDLKSKLEILHNGSAKNDISVVCIPRGEQLIGCDSNNNDECLTVLWEYNKDIFTHSFIQEMLSSYEFLLEEIMGNSEKLITEIDLLTTKQRDKILRFSGHTSKQYYNDKSIVDLLQDSEHYKSNKLALISDTKNISFKELYIVSNKLANYLLSQNAHKGTRIAVCFNDVVQQVICLLAILKIGAIYIPLDPESPNKRLKYILSDASASILLTEESLVEKTKGANCQVLTIEKIKTQLKDYDSNLASQSVSAADVASVIYTSGTTGKSKGVIVSHNNIVSSLVARLKYYKQQPEVLLLLLSAAFDAANSAILWTLLNGGTIILSTKADQQEPDKIWMLLNKHRVTHTVLVPSLYRILLTTNSVESANSLKVVILGGENCPPSIVTKHASICTRTALYNEYGPTETSVWSSIKQLYDPQTKRKYAVTIGKPIPDTHIYILDKQQQLKPIGAVGELCIGGPGVTLGYREQPNLTSDKFIKNLFEPNSRLYRTGDFGRYLENGELELHGRLDRQVKIHGFRIELDEIDAVINQHEFVEQANTVLLNDYSFKNKLATYIVCDKKIVSELKPDEVLSEINKYIQDNLSNYMRPTYVTIINEAPLTLNGKIDYSSLPKPDIQQPKQKQEEPSTKMEKVIASLWKQILHIKHVAVDDDFFHIGGDSILVMELASLARDKKIDIRVSDIYNCPTIKLLAKKAPWINQDDAKNKTSLTKGRAPLAPIQKWFFSSEFNNANYFNQAVVLDLHAKFGEKRLKSILKHLVLTHNSLRLRYKYDNGNWIQEYISKEDIKSQLSFARKEIFDIDASQEISSFEKIANQYQSEINIEDGPLIKVVLFKFHNNRSRKLLIIIHHLLVDQVSWRILLKDLSLLFEGTEKLNAETASYKDWTTSLIKHISSSKIEKDIDYWKAFTKEKHCNLPIDFDKGNNAFGELKTICFTLNKTKTTTLFNDVFRVSNITINEILITLLTVTFCGFFKNQSFYVSLEKHGRDDLDSGIDTTNTTGWFTSYFPASLNPSQPCTIIETMHGIKLQLETILARGMSYGLLCYLLKTPLSEKLSKLDLPRVVFNYLGKSSTSDNNYFTVNREYSSILKNISPENQSPHLLNITARVEDDQLQLSWSYSRNHFRESTIADIIKHFSRNIDAAINELKQMSPIILKDNALAKQTPIIKLNKTGNKKPVYCVHPIGGDVHWYYSLAKGLDNNHSFYGIKSPLLNGDELNTDMIEGMAKNYVGHIRERQAGAQYCLAGWSFGAFVAYEIARSQEHLITDSNPLVLIDQPAFIEIKTDIYSHIAALLRDYNLPNMNELGRKLDTLPMDSRIKIILDSARDNNPKLTPQAVSRLKSLLTTLFINHNAMKKYQLRSTIQKIVLFMSEKTIARIEDNQLNKDTAFGWQKYSREPVEVYRVPGDHYSLLQTPNVDVIIKKLKAI